MVLWHQTPIGLPVDGRRLLLYTMRVSFQSWGNRNGRLSMTALRVSVVHDRFSFSIQKLGGGEISRISLLCSGFLGFELLANHFSYDVIRVDSHFFFKKHTAFNCDPRIVNFLFSHVFICFSLSLSFSFQTANRQLEDPKPEVRRPCWSNSDSFLSISSSMLTINLF